MLWKLYDGKIMRRSRLIDNNKSLVLEKRKSEAKSRVELGKSLKSRRENSEGDEE
jgi:hypothetical protein